MVKMPRMPLFKRAFMLKGLNLERFINLMQKENVPLYKVQRKDNRTLQAACCERDMAKVMQLAEEKGWRFAMGRRMGLGRVLEGIRARPGILIGAALAMAMLLVALRFVWVVRIQGAGPYQADIAAYLKENGVGPGTPIARIDAKEWENRLTLRYPRMAWFHVYVSGMTLVVDCTQGRPAPEEKTLGPGDLIARCDGIVTEIRVYAGTAAVKPGDVVRRGQVLIRGQVRGRDEAAVPVRARGEVLARCWHTAVVETPLLTTADMETGREMTVMQLVTPWLAFPQTLEKPEYLNWNTYISLAPVGGVYFPLQRKTVTYREVSLEYALPDQQQLLRETRLAAEKKLRKAVGSYEIIDKWEDYCMIEDEKLSVSMTGEWIMDIGQDAT